MLFKRFRKKHGAYDLRKEVAAWVEKNIGAEFVDEALDKYDKICSGIPIGGFRETAVFLDMIEEIKEQERNKQSHKGGFNHGRSVQGLPRQTVVRTTAGHSFLGKRLPIWLRRVRKIST